MSKLNLDFILNKTKYTSFVFEYAVNIWTMKHFKLLLTVICVCLCVLKMYQLFVILSTNQAVETLSYAIKWLKTKYK